MFNGNSIMGIVILCIWCLILSCCWIEILFHNNKVSHESNLILDQV